MIYLCCSRECGHEVRDELAEETSEKMMKKLSRKPDAFPVYCPKCRGLMMPRHFEEQIPGVAASWFMFLSRCPNAMKCWEAQTYRPECEVREFYTGCLTFLHEDMREIKSLLCELISRK